MSWYTVSAFGINRYIMECKLHVRNREIVSKQGINRYIMECKLNWVY